MRQTTLLQALGRQQLTHNNDDTPIHLYDLFCGLGGFSTGAKAAGLEIAFACDSSEVAINFHRKNHPNCKHMCANMPCVLPFPTDGRRWHLHGSPPCQSFSNVNKLSRKKGDDEVPQALVEWYLNLAVSSNATSWSFEQVPAKKVMAIVERVRKQNPAKMAYHVFEFSQLGVPQTRRRVIAGSPHLIAHLMRCREEQPRRSVRDVLSPIRGQLIRNDKAWSVKRKNPHKKGTSKGKNAFVYTKASWLENCRPISRPCPAILTTSTLHWITPLDDGGCHHTRLSIREIATIQTFGPSHILPKSITKARRLVGNSVPPRVAELLLGGKPV
jgi:DNA (cytosine-5)-methyltransferase 1